NSLSQMTLADTPAYMAPEVLGGEGGPASDQYSLAFTYVWMRQGRPPQKIGDLAEVFITRTNGRFEFAACIRAPEQEVLLKAMARDPHDRYKSCSAFVEALAQVLGRPIVRKPGRSGAPGSRPVPNPPSQPATLPEPAIKPE